MEKCVSIEIGLKACLLTAQAEQTLFSIKPGRFRFTARPQVYFKPRQIDAQDVWRRHISTRSSVLALVSWLMELPFIFR